MERDELEVTGFKDKLSTLQAIDEHLLALKKLLEGQKLMLDVLAAWETPATPAFEHINVATNKLTAAIEHIDGARHNVAKVKGV